MSARGLSVFAVEDEALIRVLIADMLGELGHTVAAERRSPWMHRLGGRPDPK
jgi:hypothetical protein